MWNRQREADAAREKLQQAETDPSVNPDADRAQPAVA
jgi:hypothetical protein